MLDYTTMTVEPVSITVPPNYPENVVFGDRPKKILLLGHARHGKDTVAEMLRDDYGIDFAPSSVMIAEYIMNNFLQDQNYETPMDCFEDRVNHRPVWYEAIATFNKDDPCAHAKNVLSAGDIYCGMRRDTEYHECMRQGIFDIVVWVDALKRLPPEPRTSFNIDRDLSMWYLDNNGTLEQLKTQVKFLAEYINANR